MPTVRPRYEESRPADPAAALKLFAPPRPGKLSCGLLILATGNRNGVSATIGNMHNETIEQLIGLGVIILFGVTLVVWPPFAEFVDRFAFSYLRDFLQLLRGLAF
jgi:hypothetical protein